MPRLLQRWLREWILPVALTLLVLSPVRSAVVDWNWVPSGSMKPTILEGDLVLVNKLAYDLKIPFTTHELVKWADPRRGDVVVCFSPADGERLVKRVVGLPGDVLELRQEVLYLNGQPCAYQAADAAPFARDIFEDPHPLIARETLAGRQHLVMVLPSRSAAARSTFPAFRVPEGQYFLMGDSRDNSFDSRYFLTVPRAQIVGTATRVLASFDTQRYLWPRWQRFGESLQPTPG